MLYLSFMNKHMNQSDMVEKSLDWDMEDLVKVCPGTRHCGNNTCFSCFTGLVDDCEDCRGNDMLKSPLSLPGYPPLSQGPCPQQQVSLHSRPSADGDLLL